jgi:hypothetical protein
MIMKIIGRYAWLLLFIVGLGLAFYAYDNLVTIPALDPADPDRGWAWLSTDPVVIEYIKMWFRTLGFWVLAVAFLVMVISSTGYRKGQKWAWYSLLYLPVHISIHILLWPWLAPLLLIVLVIVLAGLVLPFRTFFPRVEKEQ